MRNVSTAAAAALTAALALAVAGCSGPDGRISKENTGTAGGAVLGAVVGSQFGKGDGKIVGALLGAFAGGVIGNDIGKKLDQRDRMLAQQAEFEALERGPVGQPRRWSNPDNGRYGEIVAQAPYQRAGRDCRDYAHTVYMEGRPTTVRGTACRNMDGTWQAV
jgi:surface antigen